MNTPLSQVASLPDGCPLTEITGTITAVYERRTITGGKTVQNAEISEAGTKVRLTVWGHEDISIYKDRAVVITAGPKGGLSVKEEEYKGNKKKVISMSAFCQFQFLEVHSAKSGAAPASASATTSHPVAAPQINGAKVGMAINNAVQLLQNEPYDIKRIATVASDIMRLSMWLEAGNLMPKANAAKADESQAAAPAPAITVASKGNQPADPGEDVPY